MNYRPENPLIVQSDHSLLLETQGPHFEAARDALLAFAELVKSPEYVHSWRITPLSLWNAAAAGLDADAVMDTLSRWAKYPIPPNIPVSIRGTMERYGRLTLEADGTGLRLVAEDAMLMTEVRHLKPVQDLLGDDLGPTAQEVALLHRGELKQVLTSHGYPVRDVAGYTDGDALRIALKPTLADGSPWALRDYQVRAIDAFYGQGPDGGCGVVVLPCGAGKTMVGLGAMARLGMRTLILCTHLTALRQWKREILARTELREEDVGEYTSAQKQLRPITLTTYQILTWRADARSDFAHFGLFHRERWGLVIYDEVHLLPAPIFRETAHLQARRRLGLTATLVREDGQEADVFSLIGPKRYDLPWKELERQGWIAEAQCIEVRVPLSDGDRLRYATVPSREQFRVASSNARKGRVVEALLERHEGDRVLIIGTYLDQLHWIARRWKLPLITGKTGANTRQALYDAFRSGEAPVLAVSRVGNFSLDIPDANVAIQISGTWGSRQEEAQRLGRILRPKSGVNQAVFYTVVSADTREQEFAERRQLFLTEQGYPYRIEHWN